MRYTVYRIIVCSRTNIIMISSLRNFSVRILDADRFTIVVFQLLDIRSNYLPGIVHAIPYIFALLSYPFLQWLVLSQKGIENTAGLQVSYKDYQTY
jgi:hypothetical protein